MSPAAIVPRKLRPNDVESYLLIAAVRTLFWSRVDIRGADECWIWTAGYHRTTIPAHIHKLNKAGLINKSGGVFSLKDLG